MFTYANGNKYDGEWKDDKKNGRGVYTFANGNKYDGEWKDGDFNGRGVMTYADGNKYDGEWKNHKNTGAACLRLQMEQQNTTANGRMARKVVFTGAA